MHQVKTKLLHLVSFSSIYQYTFHEDNARVPIRNQLRSLITVADSLVTSLFFCGNLLFGQLPMMLLELRPTVRKPDLTTTHRLRKLEFTVGSNWGQ